MPYKSLAAIGLVALNVLALQRVSAKFGEKDRSPVKDALILDSFQTAEVRPSKGLALIAVLNPTQRSLLHTFVTESAAALRRPDIQTIVIADNRTIDATHIDSERVAFVRRSAEEIVAALSYMGYRSRWMILRDGRILMSGDLRSGGLRTAISSVMTGVHQDAALGREELRQRFDALYARAEITNLPVTNGRAFLVITDIIQTSCPLVDLIRTMSTEPLMAGRLAMALPDSWGLGSAAALAETLDPDYPIERLSPSASAEWRRLTKDVGASLEYGVLLVVNDRVVRDVLVGASAMREYIEATTEKGRAQ